MPHEVLAHYLAEVERCVTGLKNTYVERYIEEIITPERANLRIRIRFGTEYLLEINEAVIIYNGALVTLDYRYHFQDGENRLIFRYDSTPHFPDLPTFPHHKHLRDETIAAQKPNIGAVLKEISRLIE